VVCSSSIAVVWEFSSSGLGVSTENMDDENADFGVTTRPRSVVSRTAQIGEGDSHWDTSALRERWHRNVDQQIGVAT
jgi:hypothetical protein